MGNVCDAVVNLITMWFYHQDALVSLWFSLSIISP